MVNFKIIDGSYEDATAEERNMIKKDYYENLDMTVAEIKKKYNLTNNKWKRIRDSLIEEFGLSDRLYNNLHNKQERGGRVPKNYYQKTYDCKYYVSKSINGRTEHFGTFKTEEQAKMCVELLKECNWDKREVMRIRDVVLSCAK